NPKVQFYCVVGMLFIVILQLIRDDLFAYFVFFQ
ncbi:MAG: hypothetical protein ACI82S_002141, partial [Patiriisocius sp.]